MKENRTNGSTNGVAFVTHSVQPPGRSGLGPMTWSSAPTCA